MENSIGMGDIKRWFNMYTWAISPVQTYTLPIGT